MHQEMPKGDAAGRMHGFQLWANLPASLKMTRSALPGYSRRARYPQITDDDGTHVRVVCGEFWGKKGPVEGVAADPIYLDVSVSPGRRKTAPWKPLGTRLRMCLPAQASSAIIEIRALC